MRRLIPRHARVSRPSRPTRFAAAAATALVLGGCGGSSPGAHTGAPPVTPASIDAPCLQGDPAAAAHVSHFEGGLSHTVEAYTTGAGPVGIVLAHQSDADLCQWSAIWPRLTARGYRVMAITMGGGIDADVVAAVAQLRAQGARKVVLIGASMGGTAVLAAAAEADPPVQAVVSLSGPESYASTAAFDKVKTLRVPVAYFAGDLDGQFADAARAMYAATAEPDKTIHIVSPSADHGVDLWSEVEDEVLAFVAAHTG